MLNTLGIGDGGLQMWGVLYMPGHYIMVSDLRDRRMKHVVAYQL